MNRGPTARLFVAVDPPAEVSRALARWARDALRGAGELARAGSTPRLLEPELLHVTLCFLGERPVGEIDLLEARLAACGGVVGELSVGAPLWLPPRRPRALAVELYDEDGKLARLRASVAVALEHVSGEAQGGERRSGARRFRPHVTVARMGRGWESRGRVLPPTPSLSFVPAELVLYRSWLSPRGASYEAVAARPIG
ncbi:MAG TPA: RNA 2',3'-cyclic phosphodiesterase [Solirubrobacteraceae bacterium]|jgi:2'-5' RNA ligase